uniref:Lysozyme n=1 Tax=Macrostomum lignano TaxID=282301 RepID=A0A1I8FV73_9PLAT
NYRNLKLLGAFCTRGGQGLAEKQAFIAKRWLADQRSGYRTALLKSHAAEGSPAGQIFPAGSHRALVGNSEGAWQKSNTSEG